MGFYVRELRSQISALISEAQGVLIYKWDIDIATYNMFNVHLQTKGGKAFGSFLTSIHPQQTTLQTSVPNTHTRLPPNFPKEKTNKQIKMNPLSDRKNTLSQLLKLNAYRPSG